MFILDVGHTSIKVYDTQNKSYQSFALNDDSFQKFALVNNHATFWIGSVNAHFNNSIQVFFKTHQIKHHFINHEHFFNKVKVNQRINFYEVGLDILSIVYALDDDHYLFINSGTALVYIKYTNQLDGVIIGSNLFLDNQKLLTATNLNFNYYDHFDFGFNTDTAISASLSLTFKLVVQYLMQNHSLQKLYVCNIPDLFLNGLNYCNKEFATLQGYIKLVKEITNSSS